jgi:4-amino-4-deoxy-L-arabinose transferase-like glycosyltransferase
LGDGLHILARPAAARAIAESFAGSRAAWVDATCVGGAALAALAFGWANLGGPSLWHDELVHVFVAQSIADTGRAALPSGEPYYNGTLFHLILAAAIRLFGAGEAVVRSPSVVLSALNVALSYWVLRPLVGRPVALVAAVGMALSPWNVAWARQARFYTLHQTLYLLHIGAFWRLTEAKSLRAAALPAAGAVAAFLLGILTSYHALIFLAAPGAFAVGHAIASWRWRTRWTWIVAGIALAGLAGIALIDLLMNTVDRHAVIDNGGLGGKMVFAEREHRMYYFDWLRLNLGAGFLLLALGGAGAMLWRGRARGAYAALAFWAPIFVLTFLIGYRWPRFMFFAYPFYVAAWACGLYTLCVWLLQPKPGWARKAAALAAVGFLARLGVSAVRLTGDSVEAARGAHTTLATQHPDWRGPCAWVKARADGAAILTTSYLPVQYYAGRVDEWYPSLSVPWEGVESGLPGLAGVKDLAAFVAKHPRGYFIAEWWRFERNYKGAPWADYSADIAWVQAHMRKVDEASSVDVTVYAWGEGNSP